MARVKTQRLLKIVIMIMLLMASTNKVTPMVMHYCNKGNT